MLVLLVSLLLSTIWLTPYGDEEEAAAGTRVIEVTGAQFAWTLEPRQADAGERIEFRIRSADVSHASASTTPTTASSSRCRQSRTSCRRSTRR